MLAVSYKHFLLRKTLEREDTDKKLLPHCPAAVVTPKSEINNNNDDDVAPGLLQKSVVLETAYN